MKRITIKDIAQYAQVSRGTVDRVLHGRGNVTNEAKAKVDEAVKVLGYVPNIMARTLAQNNVFNIAILIPSPDKDPFWQFAHEGIQKAIGTVQDFGIKHIPFYFDSEDVQSFRDQASALLHFSPDALLMAPEFYKESKELLAQLKLLDIPVIFINTLLEGDDDLSYIGQDSYQAGYIAGRLFDISLNRPDKTIIILNLGPSKDNALHLQNKEKGLRDYFIDQDKVKIIHKELSDFKNHLVLTQEVMKLLAQNPDACGLFVPNSRSHYLAQVLIDNNIQDQFCFIGFDLTKDNVSQLRNGVISFLLNQNPDKQAEMALMRLSDHLIYHRKNTGREYLPLDIIIKENVSFYLKEA